MTSVLVPQSAGFSSSNTTHTAMAHVQDAPTSGKIKDETDERPRGRRRSRVESGSRDDIKAESASEDHDGQQSSEGEGPSRKRRRSRKGMDKKFDCPQEGCGKSYSRAEHLYRHQLNHTPKQIYKCDFPGCNRTFVRHDLCARHKDRHLAKGSQLQRKDSMLGNTSPVSNGVKTLSIQGSLSPEAVRSTAPKQRAPHMAYAPTQEQSPSSPFSPATAQPSTPSEFANFQQGKSFRRSNSDHSLPPSNDLRSGRIDIKPEQQRHGSFGVDDGVRPVMPTRPAPYGQPPSSQANYTTPTHNYPSRPVPQSTYVSQQNFPPFTLPPSGFSSAPMTTATEHETAYTTASPITSTPMEYSRESIPNQQSSSEIMLFDQMAASTNTMPVFGGEGYSRSPFAIPDDFLNFLFSGQQYDSSMGQSGMNQTGYTNYLEPQSQYQSYYNDQNVGGFFPQVQHPMAVTSLLDTNLPENVLTDEKSQEIVDLIKERFNETDHAPVARQKESLLEGDRSNNSHMLSRKMMQTYIGSYWYHFHHQLPIRASCLDKVHGHSVTQAGAELSNFLAWHLRWEIFSDVHFRPPAKLWVFQSLLILELYEKMYSTRALHERAHIHHATTLTLMRRGSSLIGRSALDSPPSVKVALTERTGDDKHGVNGSRHSSASGANTPDEWWNHWITNEATRRAAFAAFVIDSTHATMFGHSTVMVAHEMRLPLPCDESLWSAQSSVDVGRIEASLLANGVKQISFLEGLKRTLNGQEVRTNSFGRTILMAGLLSVSWHMNQRDLQVNSLGVSQALGGRDKWRGTLTRAFDLWKQDFDKSMEPGSLPGPYNYTSRQYDNVVFESRTVLHHLAHMAMHVDIVDCQIFARAKRLLGRTIGPQDLNSAQRRMRDVWAPTAKARDATYYALRFLCIVLLPDESSAPPPPRSVAYEYNNNNNNNSSSSSSSNNISSSSSGEPVFDYSARDDVLLNRPWVLYFAALIVWSYGFALEGPTNAPTPAAKSFDDQLRDMRAYLRRLGVVKSPEDLKNLRGFNGCGGLLMVLKSTFEKTRWQLLHEAANLLSNCIHLIGGSAS